MSIFCSLLSFFCSLLSFFCSGGEHFLLSRAWGAVRGECFLLTGWAFKRNPVAEWVFAEHFLLTTRFEALVAESFLLTPSAVLLTGE